MTKKTVLITGGVGMLGQMLAPIIADLGHRLVVLGHRRTWPNSVSCDIRNYGQVRNILTQYSPDTIIHLAGLTGNLICETNVQEAMLTNVIGTYNILGSNIKKKARVIFASTREVYGESYTWCREGSVMNPKNMNGITKMFGEKLMHDFHVKYKIPFTILRFSNFLGENNEKNGISMMIKGAIRGNKINMFGGEQEIDPLHYDDAIEAILKSLQYRESGTFNIASGHPIRIIELIKKLENISSKKIRVMHRPQREFESAHCRLDTGKARRILGFKAIKSIDDVLERMVSKWAKV